MAVNDIIRNVCRIGQGAACCKYLAVDAKGFDCMKTNIANKAAIDQNWAIHEHVAQGDNCDGKNRNELNQK